MNWVAHLVPHGEVVAAFTANMLNHQSWIFFTIPVWVLVLVIGLKVSWESGFRTGLKMTQTLGIENGMMLVYAAIWFTIGWWMWKVPSPDFDMLAGFMYQFAYQHFQDGSLIQQVLVILAGYLAPLDMIIVVFFIAFPAMGWWYTMRIMCVLREQSGRKFTDIVDGPEGRI